MGDKLKVMENISGDPLDEPQYKIVMNDEAMAATLHNGAWHFDNGNEVYSVPVADTSYITNTPTNTTAASANWTVGPINWSMSATPTSISYYVPEGNSISEEKKDSICMALKSAKKLFIAGKYAAAEILVDWALKELEAL